MHVYVKLPYRHILLTKQPRARPMLSGPTLQPQRLRHTKVTCEKPSGKCRNESPEPRDIS